jgi:signal transduction histidine kinase
MKTIEFKPDGQSTMIPPDVSANDDAVRNELLFEVLPLIFHKLKNKLTPILGYTQILMARACDDYARERLGRIENNTNELSDSLNKLKDSFQAGPCRLQPTDLGSLLASMAADWQGVATAAQARVILELAPGLPEPALHNGRMRVLLLSLADNASLALQARAAGEREIRISTRLAGDSLKLTMRDSGRGMDEEEMAGIWAPFYAQFPGRAGLGLVLCEKIIADHGAACEVSSQPGEFSCFEIAFPLAKNDKKAKNLSQS